MLVRKSGYSREWPLIAVGPGTAGTALVVYINDSRLMPSYEYCNILCVLCASALKTPVLNALIRLALQQAVYSHDKTRRIFQLVSGCQLCLFEQQRHPVIEAVIFLDILQP